MKRLIFCGLLLAAVAVAGTAQAQTRTGYTVSNANLRAGPDVGYPRVSALPGGVPVDIYGCVDDWSWCDVQWRGERGWISAGLLEYDDSGRRMDVYSSGASIGLPILAFALGAYWSDHYRQRSWYRERDRWNGYRPPPRQPQYRPGQPRPMQGRPQQQHQYPSAGNGMRPPQGQGRPQGRPSDNQHRGDDRRGQDRRQDHDQRPSQPGPRPVQQNRPTGPAQPRPSQQPMARPENRQETGPQQQRQPQQQQQPQQQRQPQRRQDGQRRDDGKPQDDHDRPV
jgi:uncharacterized protein YraI